MYTLAAHRALSVLYNTQMEKTHEETIIAMVDEEAERIGYGHIYVDITVHNGRPTNVQAETKRSKNLNKVEG